MVYKILIVLINYFLVGVGAGVGEGASVGVGAGVLSLVPKLPNSLLI